MNLSRFQSVEERPISHMGAAESGKDLHRHFAGQQRRHGTTQAVSGHVQSSLGGQSTAPIQDLRTDALKGHGKAGVHTPLPMRPRSGYHGQIGPDVSNVIGLRTPKYQERILTVGLASSPTKGPGQVGVEQLQVGESCAVDHIQQTGPVLRSGLRAKVRHA